MPAPSEPTTATSSSDAAVSTQKHRCARCSWRCMWPAAPSVHRARQNERVPEHQPIVLTPTGAIYTSHKAQDKRGACQYQFRPSTRVGAADVAADGGGGGGGGGNSTLRVAVGERAGEAQPVVLFINTPQSS